MHNLTCYRLARSGEFELLQVTGVVRLEAKPELVAAAKAAEEVERRRVLDECKKAAEEREKMYEEARKQREKQYEEARRQREEEQRQREEEIKRAAAEDDTENQPPAASQS